MVSLSGRDRFGICGVRASCVHRNAELTSVAFRCVAFTPAIAKGGCFRLRRRVPHWDRY